MHFRVYGHGHVVALQFVAHHSSELWVNGGEYGWCPTRNRHFEAPMREGVRHLQADIPGSDDHNSARFGTIKVLVNGETVLHRVEQEDSGKLRPCDAWTGWASASANEQFVVGK
jgi:hypothetical protein